MSQQTETPSEFALLLAIWEERAKSLEDAAEAMRQTFTTLTASNLEKARAIRACINDLKRYSKP